MTRVPVAVLTGIALTIAIVDGQEATFRTGVHTVPVYASVVDRTGRLVSNLARDDFEIYDNGRLQKLTLFANDVQPITIVIMLDRSGSMARHFDLVRDAAGEFVASLHQADQARIGSFGNRIQIDPPEFTSDRAELIRILRDNLQDAGATPLWDATSVAMTALAQEKGRRVVLVFTDGYDNPSQPSLNMSFEEVRNQSQADEVMVYAIGFADECSPLDDDLAASGQARFQGRGGPGRGGPGRGLPGPIRGRPPLLPIPIPLPPAPGRGGPERGDPFGGLKAGKRGSPCEGTKPDPALKELALESGAGYFELHGTDNLRSTFTRVAEELHHQYLLGFTPAPIDGKKHTLEVRLRRPDLLVRARRSYLATTK